MSSFRGRASGKRFPNMVSQINNRKQNITVSAQKYGNCQSAFFVVRREDLPRATFAKTIESIVEPLFSPAHFPAQ